MWFAKPLSCMGGILASNYGNITICALGGSPAWVVRGVVVPRSLVRCRAQEMAYETELDHFGIVSYQRAFARCRTREHAHETELSSSRFQVCRVRWVPKGLCELSWTRACSQDRTQHLRALFLGAEGPLRVVVHKSKLARQESVPSGFVLRCRRAFARCRT